MRERERRSDAGTRRGRDTGTRRRGEGETLGRRGAERAGRNDQLLLLPVALVDIGGAEFGVF